MSRQVRRIWPAAAALALLAGCRTPETRRAPPPPPSPLAKALLRTARGYLPEEDPKRRPPLDCSDFVGRVFRSHGVRLPRTSYEMSRRGRPVESTRDLRMGDLLFFSGSRGGRRVGHVAIYDNNGIFIHQANPGEGVRLESLYSDYWREHYLKARRVIE
ncbi:MAG TPA: C40 family peptidase [Elusimicrobiota bacterium]|jgi:cell wall-associated NlpC family hydrolase|nr:C40 family peptidase [Elusimicrobiota bacterium]